MWGFLPISLYNKSIYYNEYENAWRIKDMIDIIDFMKNNKSKILLCFDILDNNMKYTSYQWAYKVDYLKSETDNCLMSYEQAMLFVVEFINNHGEEFFLTPFVHSLKWCIENNIP
ncbi:MAG TPA: hypothetical protein DDZ99_08990 [Clostridiales bacterium]|nr:hypothetical protein [Clostridiales bacterium]